MKDNASLNPVLGETACVFVGNLNCQLSDEALRAALQAKFEKVGEVEYVTIYREQQHRPSGFVHFHYKIDALVALAGPTVILHRRPLRLEEARTQCNLTFARLGRKPSADEVAHFCQMHFGPVKSVSIIKHSPAQADICFESSVDAQKAFLAVRQSRRVPVNRHRTFLHPEYEGCEWLRGALAFWKRSAKPSTTEEAWAEHHETTLIVTGLNLLAQTSSYYGGLFLPYGQLAASQFHFVDPMDHSVERHGGNGYGIVRFKEAEAAIAAQEALDEMMTEAGCTIHVFFKKTEDIAPVQKHKVSAAKHAPIGSTTSSSSATSSAPSKLSFTSAACSSPISSVSPSLVLTPCQVTPRCRSPSPEGRIVEVDEGVVLESPVSGRSASMPPTLPFAPFARKSDASTVGLDMCGMSNTLSAAEERLSYDPVSYDHAYSPCSPYVYSPHLCSPHMMSPLPPYYTSPVLMGSPLLPIYDEVVMVNPYAPWPIMANDGKEKHFVAYPSMPHSPPPMYTFPSGSPYFSGAASPPMYPYPVFPPSVMSMEDSSSEQAMFPTWSYAACC